MTVVVAFDSPAERVVFGWTEEYVRGAMDTELLWHEARGAALYHFGWSVGGETVESAIKKLRAAVEEARAQGWPAGPA